jgi:hypothetical protein
VPVPQASLVLAQAQLPAPEQTWPVPHAVSLTQWPLASQCWGTPPEAALHFFSPGVQSAQAFATQTVQVWVACEQVPWLLHVPTSWSCVELTQVATPHWVAMLAGTQSGLEPLQEALQGAVPPQALPVRADVVLVHLPCVTEHDVHAPVHALSQQYPSTQLPVEHSTLSEQDSPCVFRGAQVDPVQYLPAPQDAAEHVPEQSLLSAKHWLLSHGVGVWVGQLPWPSHNDLFMRWPPEQL